MSTKLEWRHDTENLPAEGIEFICLTHDRVLRLVKKLYYGEQVFVDSCTKALLPEFQIKAFIILPNYEE